MEEYFKPLEEAFSSYIKDPQTVDAIHSAFLFASKAHEGQKRASGEPYIIHPIAVAKTLCTYNADPTTIIAAILHDVIEDTAYSYEDIKSKFGDQVANLVEGLTKIQKISYSEASKNMNDDGEYASNFQKMLISMSKDIRVIWIKLSDRLNNMQTLKYLPMEKQVRISKETLDIYTPIAHKLGMYHIKAELEDLSFKYLYPEDYFEISKKIKYTKKYREKDIEKMIEDLKDLLASEKIKCEISGRAKNIYSIYNKMKNKGIPFDNIYDLQALRIIVDSIMNCYKVVGLVHSKYSPVPSRFKDYIAVPKPNMYQSLHTTVLNDGKIYEIQIRTKEMDEIAEKGIAAHWAYKEGVKLKKNFYESTASKLHWYNDLVKITENKDSNEEKNQMTTLFDEDVLKANVYVFTPKNQVISLPEGSTPIDFAYRIHTRIGDTFTGAIVNGKIVSIDYQFKTGDVCEIRTSPSAYGPNENWLKVVKTSGARSKIKQFLNNKNRSLLIEQGKSLINEELRNRRITLDITDELIQKRIPQERQIKTVEDLYYICGKGVFSAQALVNSLIEQEETTTNERLIELINKRPKDSRILKPSVKPSALPSILPCSRPSTKAFSRSAIKSVMLPTSRLNISFANLINFTDSSNLWKVSFFKICSGAGSSLMIALMARSHWAASELSSLVFPTFSSSKNFSISTKTFCIFGKNFLPWHISSTWWMYSSGSSGNISKSRSPRK